MKKINYKELLICILIPVLLGGIVGFLTSTSGAYQEIVKPNFAPPSIVFPIVWTILYILMGISSYLIYISKGDHTRALKIYVGQLLVNLLWPVLFFTLKAYFVSFVWLLLLIYLVLQMIFEFFKVNKLASFLQIPYLLWTVFAGILNLWIYFLNK